jgi:hypothetical protein
MSQYLYQINAYDRAGWHNKGHLRSAGSDLERAHVHPGGTHTTGSTSNAHGAAPQAPRTDGEINALREAARGRFDKYAADGYAKVEVAESQQQQLREYMTAVSALHKAPDLPLWDSRKADFWPPDSILTPELKNMVLTRAGWPEIQEFL